MKSNERSEDSYIDLADFFVLFFFQEKVKILMHLGIMHFLSSIETHLLKVTLIALSKYERGNGAKKPVFSSWVHVIKKAPIINGLEIQRA